MKFKLAVGLLLLIFLVFCLGVVIVFRLATPEEWPIPAGTLTAKKVKIGELPFVMIEGESMNYLGQIQSVNVHFDELNRRMVIARCLIRWNPFTKITVNNQWPVLYPLESMKPGRYSVVYKTKEGDATAATFDIP